MFAVIFEVQPRKERWEEYLGFARRLRPQLEAIDGFIDNERFGSKRTEGRLLSLSTWRDEKSVIRWRTQGEHHFVQEQGRTVVFKDYHLRVGEITADTAPPRGHPVVQKRFDETEAGIAKHCTITEIEGWDRVLPAELVSGRLYLDTNVDGLLDHELFESITASDKLLILASWRDEVAAKGWTPLPFDGAGRVRHRHVRIIRDYGMFDRREAPQFYPDVTPAAR